MYLNALDFLEEERDAWETWRSGIVRTSSGSA